MFNTGFLCPKCGPIQKATNKKIQGKEHHICPDCGSICKSWTRPLTERIGHCSQCGHAGFSLAMHKGKLLQCCKRCESIFDADTQKLLREGKRLNV